MMPTKNCDNGQNIDRICTKMSEKFSSDENSAKLLDDSGKIDTLSFYGTKHQENEITNEDLNIDYDHMYANNIENGELDTPDVNCQNTESEVKFWKEWLILHLDLIQQQSDEILDKERTILILQQENEMLKERISCMERGAPFQPSKFYSNHSVPFIEDNSIIEDNMTQDSSACDEDNKNCVDFLDLNCGENGEDCQNNLKLLNFEDSQTNNNRNNITSDTESQTETQQVNYIQQQQQQQLQQQQQQSVADTEIHHQIKLEPNQETKSFNLNNSSNLDDCERHNKISENREFIKNSENFDFTLNNSSTTVTSATATETLTDFDPMRNLRMNIRRKRLSNSSAVSNNDIMLEEKRPFRRFKKRRVVKDSQLLTTNEQYVIQTGETNLVAFLKPSEVPPIDIPNTTLEVPRWRLKVYASCYTMEGTENLDDEVYNKRHSRLEHDERRRKRWDVQRIREQRVIEKLKQRQERTGSGSKGDDQNEVQSLWPKLEDIRYLEVSEQLPVSAFGCPIPKIPPSEFSLPWITNPTLIVTKKVSTKKAGRRRRR